MACSDDRLGLDDDHPPFPEGQFEMLLERDGQTFTATIRTVTETGHLDCSDLQEKEKKHAVYVDAHDLQRSAALFVKDCIREKNGECPSGRAKLETCLLAYKELVDGPASSSSSESESSSSEEEVVETTITGKKRKHAKHTEANVKKTRQVVQPLSASSPSSSSASSSSASSSSSLDLNSQSKAWMMNMADNICKGIWNNGPGKSSLDQVISEGVAAQEKLVQAQLKSTFDKFAETLNTISAKEPDILARTAAADIFHDVSSDSVVNPILKKIFKRLFEMVKYRIRERLALWSQFASN